MVHRISVMLTLSHLDSARYFDILFKIADLSGGSIIVLLRNLKGVLQ